MTTKARWLVGILLVAVLLYCVGVSLLIILKLTTSLLRTASLSEIAYGPAITIASLAFLWLGVQYVVRRIFK